MFFSFYGCYSLTKLLNLDSDYYYYYFLDSSRFGDLNEKCVNEMRCVLTEEKQHGDLMCNKITVQSSSEAFTVLPQC